ncbi:MAG: penicillin-binding protein 2 [Gemmatimonadetes bacterium]|nr:penicillin-binding protein 2 [Gemmatimonadota bacterium]
MRLVHPHTRRRRATGALGIVTIVLGALAIQFFRVQMLQSNDYMLQSESNRLRPLPVAAPRGTIFDRNDRVIADNVPGYVIYVLRESRESTRETLERLKPYLALSDEVIESLMVRYQRWEPLVVEIDADFEVVSVLEERREDFPGIVIETRPKRRYISGNAVSHVLGYVNEITVEELAEPRFSEYEPGVLIGKVGIERQYEERLQGRRGVRYLEVDALGRIVGSLQGIEEDPGQPGEDIRLTLDLDLMEWIHSIFPDSLAGAVVALDPVDGGVLALYSAPTFDPNAFVSGLTPEEWAVLEADPRKPLFNRSVMGLYPPGSTWKLAAAAIALDRGVVGPHEVMPEPCTGGFLHDGLYRRCWLAEGHGYLDLAGAIANSCNVYFYQLGMKIGLDAMLEAGTRIGFAEQCGIDLPQESRGIFPAGRDFWRREFGYDPQEGEVLNLAIGQGPNSQTPLKMAQFYLALARNGSAPTPHLIENPDPTERWRLNVSSESIEVLREGLRGVTAPGGTAVLGTALEHWEVIGKTGTSQNAQDSLRAHAWFAGMAGPWGGEPEIVVVALVEFGESGSGVAAPLVAKTADFYLRRKHGMPPPDSIQTLGEHYRAGRPAPWARRADEAEPSSGEAEPFLNDR